MYIYWKEYGKRYLQSQYSTAKGWDYYVAGGHVKHLRLNASLQYGLFGLIFITSCRQFAEN
ncbi:MAG: hypothetical protein LBH30_03610 [Prevotellaceae bacterium]|jgi:hypothetical protein|nr:hypothetical protein [Prevotellaceae bacterium]